VVWIANIYMTLYGRLRLGLKREREEIEELERRSTPDVVDSQAKRASAFPRH
jgi:hypothetical protein